MKLHKGNSLIVVFRETGEGEIEYLKVFAGARCKWIKRRDEALRLSKYQSKQVFRYFEDSDIYIQTQKVDAADTYPR